MVILQISVAVRRAAIIEHSSDVIVENEQELNLIRYTMLFVY